MPNKPSYGPKAIQLEGWTPSYLATPQRLQQASATYKANKGLAKGILLSSPLVQGTQEFRYTPDLLYPTQRGWSSAWPQDTKEWVRADGRKPEYSSFTYWKWGTNEELVNSRSYAGAVGGLNFSRAEGSRPTAASYSGTLLRHIKRTINGTSPGQGLFASLIPNAPNGFVLSDTRDFDLRATNGDGANAGDYDIGSYWRTVNQKQPLDALYRLYYSKTQQDNILRAISRPAATADSSPPAPRASIEAAIMTRTSSPGARSATPICGLATATTLLPSHR